LSHLLSFPTRRSSDLASTMRRTRLAEPWIRSWPRRGTRITLFPSKRMGAVCPGLDLDLNRKVGVSRRFDWKRGNPTRGPDLSPLYRKCTRLNSSYLKN